METTGGAGVSEGAAARGPKKAAVTETETAPAAARCERVRVNPKRDG